MRRFALLLSLALLFLWSCSSNDPTCDQACQDQGAGTGLVLTVLDLYGSQVAGKPAGPLDATGACPNGGSAKLTGSVTTAADKTTTVQLSYQFQACASSDWNYALTFDGTVQLTGTFRNAGADSFTDFTLTSPSLSIKGKVLLDDMPSIAVSCPVTAYLRFEGDAWRPPFGALCGRAFGSSPSTGSGGTSGGGGTAGTAGTGGGAGDACAPYTGSYAGIYAFGWSCVNDPSLNGVGTINVHFTAKCSYTKPDGTLWLEIESIMSDNPHLGALTKEACPLGCGYMSMPPNPPTTSGPEHVIYLLFPNNAILDTQGAFTVTSGAAKIGSDVPNKDAYMVGEPAFSFAGKPDGCVVDQRTFKIDKTAL